PTASIPGGTNAAATGSGTLTVAQFSGDPVPTSASIGVFGGGSFFDVNIGSGNTFSSVSITLSGSGAEAYWWNGTTWAAVIVNGSPVTSTGSSITFTIDANSSPTVSQLTGTPFVFAKPVVTASIAAASKTYDGTNTASITACTLIGVVAGDVVGCATSGPAFSSASAGTGKTVTASVSLTGTTASNYALSSSNPSTT